MRYGLQGPNETICTACAAGTHAIGYAARLIAWGRCDAVVTGGSEAAGTVTVDRRLQQHDRAVVAAGISRPFDVDRDGFVMGEGAACSCSRSGSTPTRRGATILGEVARRGAATPTPTTSPPRRPAASARSRACSWRSTTPASTPATSRQINAHGTSTPLNDAAEAEAIASRVRRRPAARDVDQGRHRPRARRGRRARGGGRAAVDASTG